MNVPATLLIAYGNPGRGDDGLGPAFAERIAAHDLPGLTVEIDYQLTVEHALMMAPFARVIFADARMDGDGAFEFRPLVPGNPQNIGSHSVTPEVALALCQLLYGATLQAFVLGISGDKFGDMSEDLSAPARAALDLAEAFFLRWYLGDHAPAMACVGAEG